MKICFERAFAQRLAITTLAIAIPSVCFAENVKTLRIEGTATEPATIRVAVVGVDCTNSLGMYPNEHFVANFAPLADSVSVRDMLVSQFGRQVGIPCVTSPVDASRVRIGNTPCIRLWGYGPTDIYYRDFQVWISDDGTDFTLLEPQVPITVAGLTFTTFIGDPQASFPAPAVGLMGLVAMLLLLVAGASIVLARRRTGVGTIAG